MVTHNRADGPSAEVYETGPNRAPRYPGESMTQKSMTSAAKELAAGSGRMARWTRRTKFASEKNRFCVSSLTTIASTGRP